MTSQARPCVALLGGSFDPVHAGHVALAALFAVMLEPDQLRLVPAGNPWQKTPLHASAEDRIAMLALAFGDAGLPVVIDRQEVERTGASYTIDTLRNVRAEVGEQAAVVFLMGADQLMHLDSWRDWRALFALAHIGVAARPGYSLAAADLPAAVASELRQRQGSAADLRASAAGRVLLAETLAVDISATAIRRALRYPSEQAPDRHRPADGPEQQNQQDQHDQHHQRGSLHDGSLIAPVVLDYIQQHHLYKN